MSLCLFPFLFTHFYRKSLETWNPMELFPPVSIYREIGDLVLPKYWSLSFSASAQCNEQGVSPGSIYFSLNLYQHHVFCKLL